MIRHLALSCLAAALLLLPGCVKQEFFITNEQTMGNVIDGRFLSDQGIWYDVVQEVKAGDAALLAKESRALVLCDVLENTSTSAEYSYGVRLKEFIHVDEIPVLSERPEEEAPVLIDLAWASGAYLNFRLVYMAPEPETKEHAFSVVVEQEPTDRQEIVLHLYHNAGGEYYGAPLQEGGSGSVEYKQHVRFVSVELLHYYSSSDKSMNMRYTVKYRWHKKSEDGKTYLPETEINEGSGNLM